MKTALRVLIGSLSASLFVSFILLATIRFEILNKSFLFSVFEKHKVYEQLPKLLASSFPNDPNLSKEEGMDYADFVKNISPQVLKPLVENNFGQVIDFLNGESKDIIISISLSGVGFQDSSGIRWSLSELPDKNLQERIRALNGIGNTLIIATVVILVILIGIFFVYGKSILLSGGLYILALGTIGKLFIMVVGKELLNGKEPSQKLLGLLSTSLFPDITTTWLIVGGLLILLWLGMKVKKLL